MPNSKAGPAAAVAALLVSHVAASSTPAPALPISPARIDSTALRAMKAFDVPGMAVGIVKDGTLIYAKGYGVREQGKPDLVDADTLFQIGSNSKAFTAAALAILVDEGKLHWEDRVIDYLPDFRMYDPYVTREFTIRDLLTHRSGLRAGAGDLMYFPETDFTRAEVIHGLRYLKPISGFRSQFGYDNLLYMIAGQIIPAVTGSSWEDFVKLRIMAPLHMGSCAPTYERIEDRTDVATPHVVVDGQVKPIPVSHFPAIAPAGAINCSIHGMSNWLMTQLAAGKTPDGQSLFSSERSAEMWSVTTVLPLDPETAALTGTHFSGYGLGWQISDAFGRKRVSHTGGVPGTVTWVSLIPELKLGVLTFTNQEEGMAMQAVGNQILDAYLGGPQRDWVDIGVARKKHRTEEASSVEAQAAKVAASAGAPSLPLDAYAGRYTDPWRGDATVRIEGQQLVLKFSRTSQLEGPLRPYSGNVFVVRWNDRSLNADAYVRFSQSFDGAVSGMSLKAVSPATDFSFDFEDLDFRKTPPSDAH
jgi:CubicO group peptidase (beta-lactamase class C family)